MSDSKKVFLATRSFKHSKLYAKGDEVAENSHVMNELLIKGLIALKWRPTVIPIIKKKPRKSYKNMIKK